MAIMSLIIRHLQNSRCVLSRLKMHANVTNRVEAIIRARGFVTGGSWFDEKFRRPANYHRLGCGRHQKCQCLSHV